MAKKILTVGFELASEVRAEGFRSKISLLDWDIILFQPKIDEFIESFGTQYQGKPSLYDESSFALKESCAHWRREIKQAIEHGKTVIVFLPAVKEVFVDTGQRTFSGTGRNQKTTRIVEPYTNYSALPLSLNPVSASGSSMKLTAQGAAILAPFWTEFSSASEYKIILSTDVKGVCLTTKVGDKPVGAVIRAEKSSGALVLLPDIDFSQDDFFEEDEEGEQVWSSTAEQFSNRMIGAVAALDKALQSTTDITPEPTWASAPTYALTKEQGLRSELMEAERLLEAAQTQKEDAVERLRDAGRLRGLLYENGKPLEAAIIEALELMGFSAAPYKQGASEFDVVFECSEGRLLGEAEGKDNKAINIDKLRQLMMNIQEDLQRDEVSSPAKGVLFGNGYRLSEPHKRTQQFTEKCIAAAQSSNTALIATTDLYRSVQYISDNTDFEYSKLCREAILKGVGIIALPEPPNPPREVNLSDDKKD